MRNRHISVTSVVRVRVPPIPDWLELADGSGRVPLASIGREGFRVLADVWAEELERAAEQQVKETGGNAVLGMPD